MEAKITFYKVKRCGLYNQCESSPIFCNLCELLSNLEQWAIGKTLAETNVTRSSVNNAFCTYLADIKSTKSKDSYILVMWNQVPYTDAGVLSLPTNSKVGSIQHAEANSIKKNTIPGYPTYFWFLPESNIFASICFNTNINGRRELESYLKQFMCQYSKYVVKTIDAVSNTVNITGFSKDPQNEEEVVYKNLPTFESQLYPISQNLEILKNRSKEIKKITKKIASTYYEKIKLDYFQKVLEFFSDIKPQDFSSNKYSIKTEISISSGLSPDDIQKLYDSWQEELEIIDSLDYGFSVDGTLYWFSHGQAKWKGTLELTFTEQDSFCNIGSLLSEIDDKKNIILSVLKK